MSCQKSGEEKIARLFFPSRLISDSAAASKTLDETATQLDVCLRSECLAEFLRLISQAGARRGVT